MSHVVLCADAESVRRPELIGLSGESLLGQSWLKTYSSAQEAREALRRDADADEVWVVSSDDVDAVNLAAAIKRDNAHRSVRLLAAQGSGSLYSRARAAGIDEALSHQAFVARYASEKRRRSAAAPGASKESGAVSAAGLRAAPSGCAPKAGCAPEGVHVLTAAPASASVLEPGDRDAGRTCFVLPVVSGSGGAGKSTVAALAALLACDGRRRVLLLDADFQFGDMREMLGVSEAVAADEAAADLSLLGRLGDGVRTPALLSAPKRLESAEALSSRLGRLLDAVRSRYDVVVANTGANWAEQHALLLERSSRALFLIDQRASSLRACRHAVELCARCGIATTPFAFAVNRCSRKSPFTAIDASCALRGAPAFELRDGGPEVEELMSAGAPSELIASRNELCESVRAVLAELLSGPGFGPRADAGLKPVEGETGRGLFGRRRGRRAGGAS